MHVEGDLPPALQLLLLHTAVMAGYQALGAGRRSHDDDVDHVVTCRSCDDGMW